jgi:hypothetical protein
MWIMQSEERFNKETAVAWFRIFDYSLAEDDINKDMNSWSSAPSLPNPVVFLNASSYSGSGAWNDSSSHGRNATIEDGRAAKNAAGNGIVLDGRTSWTFPNIGVGNKWSLCVWYKNIGSFSPSCCILTQKYIPGKVNLSISNLNNDGSSMVVGYIGAGGPNVNGYAGGYVGGNNITSYLTNSKWVNIQATWDGTTMSTYINGSLVGSVSGQGNSSIDGGLPYRIGRRWDSAQYVTGEIGEVRIFGDVLSTSQVSILYNTTSTSYN